MSLNRFVLLPCLLLVMVWTAPETHALPTCEFSRTNGVENLCRFDGLDFPGDGAQISWCETWFQHSTCALDGRVPPSLAAPPPGLPDDERCDFAAVHAIPGDVSASVDFALPAWPDAELRGVVRTASIGLPDPHPDRMRIIGRLATTSPGREQRTLLTLALRRTERGLELLTLDANALSTALPSPVLDIHGDGFRFGLHPNDSKSQADLSLCVGQEDARCDTVLLQFARPASHERLGLQLGVLESHPALPDCGALRVVLEQAPFEIE